MNSARLNGPRNLCQLLTLVVIVLGTALSSAETSNGFDNLPQAAQASISAAIGRDTPAYQMRSSGLVAHADNASQTLTADFSQDGVSMSTAGVNWRISFSGFGRNSRVQAVSATRPVVSENRVEYKRGTITEWYVNGPFGLEQGFTLDERPLMNAQAPLTIAMTISGDVTAAVGEGALSVTLTNHNGATITYGGLSASDADGKDLQAWMEIEGSQLRLLVDDREARYPVTIDPWVQLAKFKEAHQYFGAFGESVAISGDTVVVGDPDAFFTRSLSGAAYVFVKPASGWQNMTEVARLNATDQQDTVSFGQSVAIDGDTIVVGDTEGFESYIGPGAAYVFVKPAGGWHTMSQTAKLTASDGILGDQLGNSVAIQDDTVVAGASKFSLGASGAAYVFVKPATGWRDAIETAKLTASDGTSNDQFGSAVSISGDTVVAGAYGAAQQGPYSGAAYVFVKPPGGWVNATQIAKLTASDGQQGNELAYSVAISGKTVVAGSYGLVSGIQGGAYVYVQPNGGWVNMTETAKLRAADGSSFDVFGNAVAITCNVILVGDFEYSPVPNHAEGAVYIFVEPPGGWKNASTKTKLTGSDARMGAWFGSSIATDGDLAVIGAETIQNKGAAYLFLAVPKVLPGGEQ